MGAIKWHDLISATHGVTLNQDQALAWQMVMKNILGVVTNKDVCDALMFAVDNGLEADGFRLTAKELAGWVQLHRKGENCFIKDGWIYFPDRPRTCGHIYHRQATEKELEKYGKHGSSEGCSDNKAVG